MSGAGRERQAGRESWGGRPRGAGRGWRAGGSAPGRLPGVAIERFVPLGGPGVAHKGWFRARSNEVKGRRGSHSARPSHIPFVVGASGTIPRRAPPRPPPPDPCHPHHPLNFLDCFLIAIAIFDVIFIDVGVDIAIVIVRCKDINDMMFW